ncbi:hypothetical protein Sdia_29980 [Streptomyces diastaticus subsp. diastaticus]|uniref:Uncharacterized protein n=1 Tax=Streptomyces diastaticus subsp. diastaticus TaxID=68040 RepID=A0ABQ1CQ25_STRDI|nr:hypothetical protein Sdia_29980 [Streptomyces diastaticus subsp. diastaticus]GGU26702.1 hypothetical protein GCM10015534_31590 [Streptomyces diastaticus subsp. diastaticus]
MVLCPGGRGPGVDRGEAGAPTARSAATPETGLRRTRAARGGAAVPAGGTTGAADGESPVAVGRGAVRSVAVLSWCFTGSNLDSDGPALKEWSPANRLIHRG